MEPSYCQGLFPELQKRYLTDDYLLPDSLERVVNLVAALCKHQSTELAVKGQTLLVLALKFLIVKANDLLLDSEANKDSKEEVLGALLTILPAAKIDAEVKEVRLLKLAI